MSKQLRNKSYTTKNVKRNDKNVGKDRMNIQSKRMVWWGVAIIAFVFFVLLQVPASWMIAKFYQNNQILKNVSGNFWRGQADWQSGNVRGSVAWKNRPLDFLLLRWGVDLEVHSGPTQLHGVASYGVGKTLHLKDWSGQISADSLKQIMPGQWPSNAIQISALQFKFKATQGFSQADGQVQWGGGGLGYQFAGHTEHMDIPSLQGQFTDQQDQLLLSLQDQRSQKLASLVLDRNLMLDVQLTQRLLLNVASYTGKAGLDSYVLSSRQPLLSGGR